MSDLPASAGAAGAAGAYDPTDGATVLVVDDTPDNLMLMSELLRDRYRVKIANHGGKALAIAAARPRPDLILLDVMMPGMDGHEVCRRLKADPATRDVPVIFLTAKSDVADETLGLSLSRVSASEAIARMVTSWMAASSSVRRATSASR